MINSDYKYKSSGSLYVAVLLLVFLIGGVVTFFFVQSRYYSPKESYQGSLGPSTNDPHHKEHLFGDGFEQTDASPPPFAAVNVPNSSNYR